MSEEDEIQKAITDNEIFIGDPAFYERAFSFAAWQRRIIYARDGDNFKRTCAEEYDELSKRLDVTGIQESPSVRNVLRTRRLANLLINDNGELNTSIIPRVISHLKRHLYSLGPNRQYDAKRQEQILRVLTILNNSKEHAMQLKSIDRPIGHKYAEQIIRDTLLIAPSTTLTHAHARRAVLSAWMCTLRQNVGSCFATAPALIIHDEQPLQFLKDINELLSTGRLKRTFGGVEYIVPLSMSWGTGDLKKPFYQGMGDYFEESQIWTSPGLIAAFEAAGYVDPELSLSDQYERVKHLIADAFATLDWNDPYILMTSEEIIRKVLLKNLNLTEQALIDFENKPKGMVIGGLMMQVPRPGLAMAGKSDAPKVFYNQLKAATNAFKGLADNALLKAWEFTLASFAETKAQFTRWNLYASLGLAPDDQGGIGAQLYEIINQKLADANQKVKDFQYEYEQVFHVLKTMEARMRSVSSEREAQWLRMEYQTKRNEFYTLEEMRDTLNQRAHLFANLYNLLMEQYDILFPRYFQEVYDADMHDVNSGPYDDSPAGFRLLYKHGRSNTAQWSYIRTPNEFIESLASFFVATENEVSSSIEGLDREISEITTAVVNHIRTKEFLETAFYRMAMAHKTHIIKDPLENLERIEKKPWAYTSGGTMSTLISCYYKLENIPAQTSRTVDNPTELLVYFVDTLKQIPPRIMEDYLANPSKAMLMHSPTHAFLLKPGLSPLREAWLNDAYTYIWVRDNIINPAKDFVDEQWLEAPMMHYLVEQLTKSVHINHRHFFVKAFGNLYGQKKATEFREFLLETMQRERGLKRGNFPVLPADRIDHTLYSMLPLFSRSELRERLENLYSAIPHITDKQRETLLQVYDKALPTFSQTTIIDAETLQSTAKGLYCLAFGETTLEVDMHMAVSQAAQQLKYAMPTPIIFADTNWVKDDFGFVVNPGTGQFELWRMDSTGRVGWPMSQWEQWVDGSRKDIPWGIYTKPYEYSI